MLLLLAALCASLGLMLAGGSTFSLLQAQAALGVVGTLSLPGTSAETVFTTRGRVVAALLRWGLGLASTFAVLIGVVAFVRHGGHLDDRWLLTLTNTPVAGAAGNNNRNWIPWNARQRPMELPRHGQQTPVRGFPAPRGRRPRGYRH